MLTAARAANGHAATLDPPSLKWSDLRYVFDIKEDCNWQGSDTSLKRAKLRQVDVLVSQGQNMVDAIRQIGVSEVTYYRWAIAALLGTHGNPN